MALDYDQADAPETPTKVILRSYGVDRTTGQLVAAFWPAIPVTGEDGSAVLDEYGKPTHRLVSGIRRQYVVMKETPEGLALQRQIMGGVAVRLVTAALAQIGSDADPLEVVQALAAGGVDIDACITQELESSLEQARRAGALVGATVTAEAV